MTARRKWAEPFPGPGVVNAARDAEREIDRMGLRRARLKGTPLLRVVASAQLAALSFLGHFEGNDVQSNEWDRKSWNIDRSRMGALRDLSDDECADLWPVYAAVVVYCVHRVRPYKPLASASGSSA